MTILVKLCGISTEDALEAAIDAGADYAGFVFFERSPRHVTLSRAAALARRAEGRIKTVALTVNAEPDAIKVIAGEVRPDFFQLHGNENVERIGSIRSLTSKKIIKAIKVGTPCDIQGAALYEDEADLLLFDAQASAALPGALPGGNGLSFDWRWLQGACASTRFHAFGRTSGGECTHGSEGERRIGGRCLLWRGNVSWRKRPRAHPPLHKSRKVIRAGRQPRLIRRG